MAFKGTHWTKMKNSNEIKERIRQKNLGKRYSANPIYKNNHFNGKSPYRYNILVKRLLSPENKCMACKIVSELKNLHLHHEDIFNRQPETVDISKLKILCPKCHKKADIELWNKYKESEVA